MNLHSQSTGNFFPSGYLPVSMVNAPGDFGSNKKNKELSTSQSAIRQPKEIHIVLADDDEDDRDLFADAMAEIELKVKLEFAEDGRSLLEKLHHSRSLPDMIFLDLNMPDKSGRECLDEIRRSDKLKKIPVIIYSTSSSPKDIHETFEKGANLYIRKPSSYKDLLSLAQKVLLINWDNHKPMSSRSNYVFSVKA